MRRTGSEALSLWYQLRQKRLENASQDRTAGVCLAKLITEIVESERVVLIGEKYFADALTAARQISLSNGILWIPIDMNTEQRIATAECSRYSKDQQTTRQRMRPDYNPPPQNTEIDVPSDCTQVKH
jgi:hypothetical protein